jgi:hypothetical protein
MLSRVEEVFSGSGSRVDDLEELVLIVNVRRTLCYSDNQSIIIVPLPPPDASKPRRIETTDAQRSKVIMLFELGFTYAEIVARTGVKKTNCSHIVQRDKERWKPGSLIPYTASAPRSGRPKKFSKRQKRYLISLAK